MGLPGQENRKEGGGGRGQNKTICGFEELYFFLSEGHKILCDRNNL